MGELYNPYPKLPKNIRQIGERDQVIKLYVEDYVNTYLKRLYPVGGQDLRAGLLVGEIRTQDGQPVILADGALEMEGITAAGEKVEFTEEAWKKAYETMEQMFPRRSVLGWFLCGAPGAVLSPLNYWRQHSQYFAGKHQLMYLNSGLEGEEAVYTASEDGFYKLQGYCIYYERNQMMQDYMVSRKDARRVESGSRDVVIRDFRQKMEDRKVEATKSRSTVRMLGTACGVLAVMVLAGGVTMVNNYKKMKGMEAVIASAVPEGVLSGWVGEGGSGADGLEDVLVEHVSGDVYPTQEEIVIDTGSGQQGAGQEGTGQESSGGGASGEGGSQDNMGSGPVVAGGNGTASGEIHGTLGTPGAGQAGGSGDGSSAGSGGAGSGRGGSGSIGTGSAGTGGTGTGGGAAAGTGQTAGTGTTAGAGQAAGQSAGSAGGGGAAAGGGQSTGSAGGGGAAAGVGQNAGGGAATGGGQNAGGAGSAGSGQAQSASAPVQIPDNAVLYTVQPGETLYSICMERYQSMKPIEEICRWNGLEDENRLAVGQNLYVPAVGE